MAKVKVFSKGKSDLRNEDHFGYTDSCFVIADGATDKSGKLYNGKTGGEIISRLVVNECLSTQLTGVELVNHLNKLTKQLYSKLKIQDYAVNGERRFSCGFICVRINNLHINITYLGDLGFRINGIKCYQETKSIDSYNSDLRSKFIQDTNNVEGSRQYILPSLLQQYRYQNNANDSMGYGVIDGTHTPSKFIKSFDYEIDQIEKIELFSDGYFDIPKGQTINDWEESFRNVEELDPDKWLLYKSTKSKDDRTIAIIEL